MGHKYSFAMTHEDGSRLILEGNKITLDEIIEDFKAWLKGCEFSYELIGQIGRDEEVDYGN